MTWDIGITLGVTVLAIVGLVIELTTPEVVLMAAVTVLMLAGVLSPAEAASGFGAVTVLTVGALFVLGEGVRRTGVLFYIGDLMLGRKTAREPLVRMMLPSALVSTVLGNTLIVAMLAPTVLDWCKRNDVAPSRLLMPLSFATILGGTWTLIGTSTNLVVNDFMIRLGMGPLAMFELAWIGVPITAVGLLVIWLLAGRLLSDRRDPLAALATERRQYFIEMRVEAGERLDGRSLEASALRELPNLRLLHLERRGDYLDIDEPELALRDGDRLVFAGSAAAVVELRNAPGLSPAPEAHYDPLDAERRNQLYEVVVSVQSPLVGTTIQDLGFRRRYDAAVIAVHRAGRELAHKLGQVELRAGDTLMIEANRDFGDRWAQSGDFALVSRLRGERRPMRRKAPHAVAILLGMVAAIASGQVPVLAAVFLAVGCMLLTGILTPNEARRSLRLSILITIAGAITLGHALEETGAAPKLAELLVAASGGWGPQVLLIVTLVLAVVLSSFVTNVAAAAMSLPIIADAAALAGYEPRPFAVALAIGCSASFITPFGYQTNLMVYGPGGYRFSDFVRLGLPLTLAVCAVAVFVIPLVWPFTAG
ncbi:SLC13 family permease [Haliangium ochraceum]|uniref:Citrate transporter n=1 Tax=Haliangium ochraceum (strain DSM 14365 / JCM 11303 / SMP-2) TaxID=502025 RepID=D0LVB7_HALO1|nr:SLC13 family permease [Haliangium ochraceum]ACY17478.1 Citrate transporter [Haliangium ochraceum DSM 14365]